MIRHDALVIGGGLAGLRAAVELAQAGIDVAVLSRVHPLRSHSLAAQGGINASLNNIDGFSDDPDKHAFDTIKGSDYLADQQAVKVFCQEAPAIVREMDHWGCLFSRTADGRIAQRPFGAAAAPRTCYAADRTGHMLMRALFGQALRLNVRIYVEWFVTSLVTHDGRVVGLVAMDQATGRIEPLSARAVVLATGGYGRIYARSTNAIINTGAGLALAMRAGAPLRDMEFVQFHPTTLYGTNILLTEGARGEGGRLFNATGERFMERYAPNAVDLASRDLVARSIQTEVNEGRGFEDEYVHLDLRHLGAERITSRLPGIRQIAMDFAGVDPIDSPLPIQPGQHYSMGGVATDIDGATEVSGLFAAGECACVSVHGANRLGGNSLLETLVFGRRSGQAAARYVKQAASDPPDTVLNDQLKLQQELVARLRARRSGVRPGQVLDPMKTTMFENVGIFRSQEGLAQAARELAALRQTAGEVYVRDQGECFNFDLVNALETPMMVEVASVIVAGALARTESRGSHARTDYPRRDDAYWLRHTRAVMTDSGPALDYTPVDIRHYPPQARIQ